jgi:hypothetical protein
VTAPVEYIVLEFPGNQFNGDVVPALSDLIERGIVRIVDLLFVAKDAEGEVAWFELQELGPDVAAAFGSLVGDGGGLVSEADIDVVAADLANETSAAVIVWEDAWAERFADAVRGSAGQVLAHERIPSEVVEAALVGRQGPGVVGAAPSESRESSS